MRGIALIGKKIGMTREFYKTGQSVPVTVLKMEKARVIQVIDSEKRGYKAVQLGYGKIKNSKLTKAMKGYFAKKNTEAKKRLKEFRVENVENFKEGNEFGLEIFKDIKFVDTKSKTIGKGFAGAMKRKGISLDINTPTNKLLEKSGYGKIKNSKLTKAMKGYFAKKNTEAKKKLKEFRVENVENFKEGNEFGLEMDCSVKIPPLAA